MLCAQHIGTQKSVRTLSLTPAKVGIHVFEMDSARSMREGMTSLDEGMTSLDDSHFILEKLYSVVYIRIQN